MKQLSLTLATLLLLSFSFYSCTNTDTLNPENTLSNEILEKISALGFSTDGATEVDGGYLVEGDIFLSVSDLNSTPREFKVPNEEQYHTFNLVTGTPREIGVYLDRKISSPVAAGTQAAIARYNAEELNITFALVSRRKDADIIISAAPRFAGYLASAGFPTSGGDPHNSIKVNQGVVNSWAANTITSIMAHEIGHCIGFRHTDWFDRSISCGGDPVFEGQENSGVGAVHIPGTPDETNTTVQQGSFMLSCIGNGINRPFNNDDKTALDHLYN